MKSYKNLLRFLAEASLVMTLRASRSDGDGVRRPAKRLTCLVLLCAFCVFFSSVKTVAAATLTVEVQGLGIGTITSSPPGIDCGVDCTENFPIDPPVVLTATPDALGEFAGWSGDADCSDGIVTMDIDKTCIANFGLDSTPPTGSIQINSGSTSTNSFNVTLNLSCDDGPGHQCSQMQFTENLLSGYSDPEPYAPTKSWTLPCSSGTKTVYVRFFDGVGYSTPFYPASIDYTPNTAMSINYGAPIAPAQSVQLATNPVGCPSYTCTGRSVKNEIDSSFASYTCGSPAAWTLSAGSEQKTVYMTESYACYETNASVCGTHCSYWYTCGFSQCCGGWVPNSCMVSHSRDMCDTIQLNTSPVAVPGGPYVTDIGSGAFFNGTGSYDPDAGDGIAAYSWSIASGAYMLSGATPSLSAAQVDTLGAGTFPVQLTVTDGYGAIGTASTSLTVYTNVPVASFTAGPNPAACHQTLSFNGSSSYQTRPDRVIVSYAWDFGDGAVGNGVTTTHAYSQFGSFNAQLTVTDNNVPPKTDVATVQVNINQGNVPPVANAGGPYVSNAGEALLLNGNGSSDPNTACGDAIASYEWDLDNNGTYDITGAAPLITWSQMGSYGLQTPDVTHTIRLRVTDSLGASATATTTVTVVQHYVLTVEKAGSGAGTVSFTLEPPHNGTLVNSPSWTEGRFNGGLSLSNGTYVTVPNVPDVFNITGDLTIAMWVKPNSVTCSGPDPAYVLVSKRSSNIKVPYEFMIGCGGSLRYGAWGTNITWPGAGTGSGVVTTGVWQHVAMTRSYSGIDATVTFYVNGVSVGSSTQASGPTLTNNDPLWISRGGYHTGYTSQGSYSGLMDDVRIYNRAITGTEMARIYANNDSSVPDIVGNWKFDESSGTVAFDSAHQDFVSCGTNCTSVYDPADSVALIAVPDPSSLFTGWDGACSGIGTCHVTMDSDKAVNAGFARISVPLTFNYQGFLADLSGQPINGQRDFTFTLYRLDGTPVWAELHDSVQVTKGLYSAVLGSSEPLNAVSFGEHYHLGIKINNDTELSPRLSLTGIGYSLRSARTDGFGSGSVTTDALSDGSITLDKLSDDCSEGQVLRQGVSGWGCGEAP